MIVVRDVFQARYGKGGELVTLLKEAQQKWSQGYAHRILTDASGPFFTVVTETELADWAAWQKRREEVLGHPDFGSWFARMTPLVDSGRREFYNLE